MDGYLLKFAFEDEDAFILVSESQYEVVKWIQEHVKFPVEIENITDDIEQLY